MDKPEETLVQKRIRESLEEKKKEERSSEPPKTSIDSDKYDVTNMALADFLGVKSEDWAEYRDKLAVIREWGEVTARSQDRVEILSVLKYLEDKIAPPSLAEDRVKNMYRYIRLDMDSTKIQKEKELYEK